MQIVQLSSDCILRWPSCLAIVDIDRDVHQIVRVFYFFVFVNSCLLVICCCICIAVAVRKRVVFVVRRVLLAGYDAAEQKRSFQLYWYSKVARDLPSHVLSFCLRCVTEDYHSFVSWSCTFGLSYIVDFKPRSAFGKPSSMFQETALQIEEIVFAQNKDMRKHQTVLFEHCQDVVKSREHCQCSVLATAHIVADMDCFVY